MKIIDESIYVRASLSSICNFDCVYCPKDLGMENQVPENIRGNLLSLEEYKRNLNFFSDSGIKSITYTGGEPALNKDLKEILKYSKKLFKNVEITTNGFNFRENIELYKKYVDKIKISLDAMNINLFEKLTNKNSIELEQVKNALILSAKKNLLVGVNVVVMKNNLSEINKIINFCSDLNKQYGSKIYISLLDLYYVPTKKDFWLSNFIPLNIIKDYFLKKEYNVKEENRFGCNFYWLKVNNVDIRFKDSLSGTQRSLKCENCMSYCQEGVYSIKHSIEGYCTTCPLVVNQVDDIYLNKHLSHKKFKSEINRILSSLLDSKLELFSFEKFLTINNLNQELIDRNPLEIYKLLENE